MDLEEWVMLQPHDGSLDYLEEDGKRVFTSTNLSSNPTILFNTDHFICPSSPPPRVSKVMVTSNGPDEEAEALTETDPVCQVSFKNLKENDQSVDMTLNPPKSSIKGTFGKFNFEDETDHDHGFIAEAMETRLSSPRIKKEYVSVKREVIWREGLNLWKWSLTGIGAICSFGVAAAAATICVIIVGSHQKDEQQPQNQKLRSQIYTDDKRIKQVVDHAARLNEAMRKPRITSGGYFHGL